MTSREVEKIHGKSMIIMDNYGKHSSSSCDPIKRTEIEHVMLLIFSHTKSEEIHTRMATGMHGAESYHISHITHI